MEAVKRKEGIWFTEVTIHSQTEHGMMSSITGCCAAWLLPSRKALLCICYDWNWIEVWGDKHICCDIEFLNSCFYRA
jgi:hypothetical protein